MTAKAVASPGEQLRAGRLLLGVGLGATLVSVLAFLADQVALGLVSASLAVLAGVSGINQVGVPLGLSPLQKYGAMLLGLLPGLNLLPLGWALKRVHTRLLVVAEDERLERVRRQRLGSTPPLGLPSAPAPKPVADEVSIARAIACVKLIGVGDAPEGTLLSANSASPPKGKGHEKDKGQEPVLRACKGVFGVMYVVETAKGFVPIHRKQMEAGGLTLEQLHALALRNLEVRVQRKPGLKVLAGKGGANMLRLDGDFEASAVLLDVLWEGPLIKLVPNGALVALPSREVCGFCDLHSTDGAEALRKLVEQVTAAGGPGLLSKQLLVRQHGRWRLM